VDGETNGLADEAEPCSDHDTDYGHSQSIWGLSVGFSELHTKAD